MSEKIVQLNEEAIKGQIKELVRGSVEKTLNELLEAEAEKLEADAHLLEEAGCFAIVLEKIPAAMAGRVASELHIPIIGIGAGSQVDGQVLVVNDMLWMNKGFSPKFFRRYADLHTVMTDAIGQYVSDVKARTFPDENEQY